MAIAKIRLVVGLGNPGSEYEGTRHNAGAFFVHELARQAGQPLSAESKFFGYTARVTFAGSDLRLLVPSTFMNRSGKSVAAMANFYRITPEEILIAHDELDIPPGQARFKQGGGHGGHNGLRDIDRHIGQDYWRIRIGIGRPDNPAMDVKSWVLADFTKTETSGWLPDLLGAISDEAPRLTTHDDSGFMSRVAFLAPPPKPPQNETQ